MFKSIADDVKASFQMGNMVVRIVIINVAVYMVLALTEAFAPSFAKNVFEWLAIPGDPIRLIFKPWTVITHLFVHSGFWHMAWNMLIFYWFGNIVGDLLGDRRIVPVYFLGGFAGATAYIFAYMFLNDIGYMAMGASAAVMALVFTAVAVAPDYNMRLLIIGDVKIKFIGLFILFFDIIGMKSSYNSGGHIAHLGGALFGFAFVYLLKNGTDLSKTFNAITDVFISLFSSKPKKRASKLRVEYKASDFKDKVNSRTANKDIIQSRVDQILEKIKHNGYDSLNDEEKEILYQASKDD